MKQISTLLGIAFLLLIFGCSDGTKTSKKDNAAPSPEETVTTEVWAVDFLDEFDTFNEDNWQDQRIWVNNENHCYVPDGEFGTREVSDGTLKIKVVNIGQKKPCDNFDKHGNQHPETEYVAGRICFEGIAKSLLR